MAIASKVHEAAARVAPVIGVSIGDAADKSTWRIDFEPDATESQKDSAQAVVAAFDPDAISVDDVRAEAQRRIIRIMGATDIIGCIVRQLNANMRATELNDIRATRSLTAAEELEAESLRNLCAAIKGIRDASNAIGDKPLVDYASDAHWV